MSQGTAEVTAAGSAPDPDAERRQALRKSGAEFLEKAMAQVCVGPQDSIDADPVHHVCAMFVLLHSMAHAEEHDTTANMMGPWPVRIHTFKFVVFRVPIVRGSTIIIMQHYYFTTYGIPITPQVYQVSLTSTVSFCHYQSSDRHGIACL